MGRARTILALDADTLHAVELSRSSRSASVRRGGTSVRPGDVDPANPQAVGAWIAGVCADLGVSRRRVTWLLPRDEHVASLVELPEADLSETEVVGLVRHRAARASVPLDDEAPIDFIPLPPAGDAPARTLLAVGMPSKRAEWYREVVRAAGLGTCRLEPWSHAVAGLARSDDTGTVRLIIAVAARSAQMVIALDGVPLLARRVMLPDANVPERLAVELVRTLSAYRASEGAAFGDPGSVLIAAPESIAADLCRLCALEGGLPTERLVEIPGCAGLERLAPAARWSLASLVGTALDTERGSERHDLLAPRQAPDTTARTRQGFLAAAFVLIAAVGVVYVIADGRARSLDRQIEARADALNELRDELEDLIVRGAKAQHGRAYMDAHADWPGELDAIAGVMPGPESILLDTLSARATDDIIFRPGDGGSFRGDWLHEVRTGVRIAGQAASRDAGLGLREALLATDRFSVRSRGADTDDRFDLELDATHAGGQR